MPKVNITSDNTAGKYPAKKAPKAKKVTSLEDIGSIAKVETNEEIVLSEDQLATKTSIEEFIELGKTSADNVSQTGTGKSRFILNKASSDLIDVKDELDVQLEDLTEQISKLPDVKPEVLKPTFEPKKPAHVPSLPPVKNKPFQNNLPVEESRSIKPAPIDSKYKRNKGKVSKHNVKPDEANKFPDHQSELALLIKNNAEIRRFTANGIINYLTQKGVLRSDRKHFVEFQWNKCRIKTGHITKDYEYSEPFFINALVAAFTSFSNSAQVIIDNFTTIEINRKFKDVVDIKEIEDIVAMGAH